VTLDLLVHARRALSCADAIAAIAALEPTPDDEFAHALADLRLLADHVIADLALPPGAHPLTVARLTRRWSYQRVATATSRASLALGHGSMAAERQKIWRWERRGIVPERRAQLALAYAFGIPLEEVDRRPWPAWLIPPYNHE
jgi:hypothetical protein